MRTQIRSQIPHAHGIGEPAGHNRRRVITIGQMPQILRHMPMQRPRHLHIRVQPRLAGAEKLPNRRAGNKRRVRLQRIHRRALRHLRVVQQLRQLIAMHLKPRVMTQTHIGDRVSRHVLNQTLT